LITVSEGELEDQHSAQPSKYSVCYLDSYSEVISTAFNADESWKEFRGAIIKKYVIPNLSGDDAKDIALFQDFSLEDYHWNWTGKAMEFSCQNYLWFFLESQNKVQGLAIIYHPTRSALFNYDIFYIDYVAAAPWNRNTPATQRVFSGVGSILLKAATLFCTQKFNYAPGFSLHSLPKAESYYSKIGMTDLGQDASKQNLRKFEMCHKNCLSFLNQRKAN
jgi:hypothetical protein